MSALSRLVYRRPGKPHNFLMYPFLLIMAAYGIAFVFFPTAVPVISTALYSLTLSRLDAMAVTIWGVSALVITATNVVALLYRNRTLGVAVSIAGFILWSYALCIDILSGFLLQIFISALPNMMFWGWYYIQIIKYHDYEDELDELLS